MKKLEKRIEQTCALSPLRSSDFEVDAIEHLQKCKKKYIESFKKLSKITHFCISYICAHLI